MVRPNIKTLIVNELCSVRRIGLLSPTIPYFPYGVYTEHSVR